ncbi:hypothetical protein BX616_010321 [Lobosporangium transversale]|uniref:F-box domain-containing protein n=1 Tax=Lobosporangium transversale TaxID=64571 RepID=A0A1Y2GCB6_9FUNG|nr:hypothetical protein BCR41DRAFT_360428 [Lobosporangium transversale]KAF9912432.1 hypothetical protein BX616_010321 [Lobosporangium transversale]ORZ06962.1 hypothetical protein BCR41DRAFT_360428 [Lobosporangium transversale]|eukprot:XP_021877758.1 hypothetical protein BCR41DRAFT_360428 [Lobosporangium transversale]
MKHIHVIHTPELASRIAQYLSPHELTVCLRVNHSWLQAFVEALYKHICTFDFGQHLFNIQDETPSPNHSQEQKTLPMLQNTDNIVFPRALAYSTLIKTIVVANVHSFLFLAGNCTNLTHASVNSNLTDLYALGHRASPSLCAEQQFWRDFFKMTTLAQTADIWVNLINKNRSLSFVRMELWRVKGVDKIAEALGTLQHLKVLSVHLAEQSDACQAFLDHCPSIETLVWDSSNGTQRIALCPQFPTQIRHLQLDGWSLIDPLLVDYIIRRCPRLERLSLPFKASNELLFTVANSIQLSGCFATLERIDFDCLQSSESGNMSLDRLLTASGCLLSISFSRAFGDLDAAFYLRHYDLSHRLERFSFHFSFIGMELNDVVTVLEICPKLQLFEIEGASVNVERFLQMLPWGCRSSLKRLRMSISCSEAQLNHFKEEENGLSVSGADDATFSESEHRRKQDQIINILAQLWTLEELVLDPCAITFRVVSFPLKIDRDILNSMHKLRHLRLLSVLGTRYVI